MRLLILKLTALLAAESVFASGCNMPSITPQPVTPAKTQQVEVVVRVEDGKLTVNDATIQVKSSTQSVTPAALSCDCGCGQPLEACDANCPRRAENRSRPPSSASVKGFTPQIVTQKVYQCRNGVCGWYDVPVVSSGSASLRNSRRPAGEGKIVVYWQRGNPASEAMRAALKDVNGIDWETSQSPIVNGNHWYPTATLNGRTWVPFNGWDGNSAAEFRAWATQ